MNILLYTPLTIYLHAQQHAMQGARLQARDSPNDNKQTNKTIKKKRLKCGAKQGYFHSGSISLFLYSSDANGDPVWMQF